jgi:hypothetical protein
MSTHKITGLENQVNTAIIQSRIEHLMCLLDVNEEPDDLYYAWPGTKNVDDYREEDVAEYRELIRFKIDELFWAPPGAWTGEDEILLIEHSYFPEHAYQLARDLHGVNLGAWPFDAIDWEQAADHLTEDYGMVTLFGNTFYYCKI